MNIVNGTSSPLSVTPCSLAKLSWWCSVTEAIDMMIMWSINPIPIRWRRVTPLEFFGELFNDWYKEAVIYSTVDTSIEWWWSPKDWLAGSWNGVQCGSLEWCLVWRKVYRFEIVWYLAWRWQEVLEAFWALFLFLLLELLGKGSMEMKQSLLQFWPQLYWGTWISNLDDRSEFIKLFSGHSDPPLRRCYHKNSCHLCKQAIQWQLMPVKRRRLEKWPRKLWDQS